MVRGGSIVDSSYHGYYFKSVYVQAESFAVQVNLLHPSVECLLLSLIKVHYNKSNILIVIYCIAPTVRHGRRPHDWQYTEPSSYSNQIGKGGMGEIVRANHRSSPGTC